MAVHLEKCLKSLFERGKESLLSTDTSLIMVIIRVLLTLFVSIYISIDGVNCVKKKGKEVQSTTPASTSSSVRTSGTIDYHKFKAKRNADFHSRAKVAHAQQIAQSLLNPKDNQITLMNDMKPVVDHFDVKARRNEFAVLALTELNALPGPKSLRKLRLKERREHALSRGGNE